MEKPSSGARIWGVVVAILIVAGVAAYFAGNAVEHAARARDAKAAEQQYAAAKTQIDVLQSVNQLLTANVWAYRAAVALDNRNFGIANDAVVNVVTSLKGVNAAAAGLDGKALTALQNEAATVKISVASDLEAQRNQLTQLAAGITVLAGKSTAAPTSTH